MGSCLSLDSADITSVITVATWVAKYIGVNIGVVNGVDERVSVTVDTIDQHAIPQNIDDWHDTIKPWRPGVWVGLHENIDPLRGSRVCK